MIRQAAAYAIAASIGAVVGTFTGCIFGVAIISFAYSNEKTAVFSADHLQEPEEEDRGNAYS